LGAFVALVSKDGKGLKTGPKDGKGLKGILPQLDEFCSTTAARTVSTGPLNFVEIVRPVPSVGGVKKIEPQAVQTQQYKHNSTNTLTDFALKLSKDSRSIYLKIVGNQKSILYYRCV
jgi:hypothetical protein